MAVTPGGTNLSPPNLGPGPPDYPRLRQLVRVTYPVATADGVVYRGFLQQWTPRGLRDREPVYFREPNGIAVGYGAVLRARLAGGYAGLPLLMGSLRCCVPAGGFLSVSSSSRGGVSASARAASAAVSSARASSSARVSSAASAVSPGAASSARASPPSSGPPPPSSSSAGSVSPSSVSPSSPPSRGSSPSAAAQLVGSKSPGSAAPPSSAGPQPSLAPSSSSSPYPPLQDCCPGVVLPRQLFMTASIALIPTDPCPCLDGTYTLDYSPLTSFTTQVSLFVSCSVETVSTPFGQWIYRGPTPSGDDCGPSGTSPGGVVAAIWCQTDPVFPGVQTWGLYYECLGTDGYKAVFQKFSNNTASSCSPFLLTVGPVQNRLCEATGIFGPCAVAVLGNLLAQATFDITQ